MNFLSNLIGEILFPDVTIKFTREFKRSIEE